MKFKTKNTKLRANQDGFTLGELTVAISLFIIIISIAMGTFVQSLRGERAVISNTEMTNNISQAIERMAREIRTGFNFTGTSTSSLQFTNAQRQNIVYQLSSGSSIERCVNTKCMAITAEDVTVNNLQFLGDRSDLPIRITILLGVDGLHGGELNFQTTVSARDIE